MRRVDPSHPFFTAPVLVLVISVFMIFVQFAQLDTDSESAIYGVMILLQIVVLAIPAGAFCYLKGGGYLARMDIYAPRKNSLPVILFGSATVILTSAVIKFGIFNLVYDYSLYGSSIDIDVGSVGAGLLMVLSLAIFPAVTEEFVFRGIILREYKECGSVFSIVMSALLFAFIHFDIVQFPIYFALGMLLAWMAFITKSVWTCVIVHTVYNLYAVFAEKYVWMFSTNPDSRILFWLILTVIWFVCGFFFIGAAEKVMRYCSDNGDSAPKQMKKGERRLNIFEAVTDKPFLIDAAVFGVIGLINLIAG